MEQKYKVAYNENTQVKYLKIVLKYSTWVNLLGYNPSPTVSFTVYK